jgi:hypothetical protein
MGFNPATKAPWGTRLEVHVTGIRAGTTCQFWVATARGQDVQAGGLAIAAGQQNAWYPASAPVPVSGLRGFEVTSAGKTLVTVPAHRAGAPPPTRRLSLAPAGLAAAALGGAAARPAGAHRRPLTRLLAAPRPGPCR